MHDKKNFRESALITLMPDYVAFMQWELVRTMQHDLSTEKAHFPVVAKKKMCQMLSWKQSSFLFFVQIFKNA